MNVQCSIIELTNEVSRVDDNDFTQGCFPGGHTSGDHRTRRSAPSVGNILILEVSTINLSTKWKVNWPFQWKVSFWKISCNSGLSLIIEQWTLGFDRKKHNFQKIIWGVSAIFCQLRHQSYHTTINSTTSTVSHWKGKLVRVFIIATGLMFLSIILVLWRFVVCRLW